MVSYWGLFLLLRQGLTVCQIRVFLLNIVLVLNRVTIIKGNSSYKFYIIGYMKQVVSSNWRTASYILTASYWSRFLSRWACASFRSLPTKSAQSLRFPVSLSVSLFRSRLCLRLLWRWGWHRSRLALGWQILLALKAVFKCESTAWLHCVPDSGRVAVKGIS